MGLRYSPGLLSLANVRPSTRCAEHIGNDAAQSIHRMAKIPPAAALLDVMSSAVGCDLAEHGTRRERRSMSATIVKSPRLRGPRPAGAGTVLVEQPLASSSMALSKAAAVAIGAQNTVVV